VGHELSALDPNELQTLRAIYSAIKDGETTWKAVMDDKAEKEAEAKAAKKPAAEPAKAAPKATTKKNPEPAESGDVPTQESAPDDNDMFG
jgi:membrane protein involved in colicin uptake